MNRYLLEYQGKTHHVESCATCPARTKDENGKSYCEIRNKQLRATLRGLFPGTNFSAGSVRCPVHPEVKGRRGRPPKSESVDKIPIKEKPKISNPLYCCWCGMKIDLSKAVIIINDREPNRIYDKFHCLEEYLRTN